MASTSDDVGVGSSSAVSGPPVAFSLRRKQSVTRSPRLNSRPERRLYSGKTPAIFTSGIDRSRWPAFMWQLVHAMPPGASRGVSAGVLVNRRKPLRISSDNRDVSSVLSSSGFRGTTQAAFIETVAATSGPVICTRVAGTAAGGSGCRAHAPAARATIMTARPTVRLWRLISGLTYHSTHHDETKRAAHRPGPGSRRCDPQRPERHQRNASWRHQLREGGDHHRLRGSDDAGGGGRAQADGLCVDYQPARGERGRRGCRC